MSAELGLFEAETALALEMLDQGLPPLTRTTWLPFLFGVAPKLIGAMGRRSDKYYRRFRIPKRRGGHREIVTPRRFLKTIQRWLLHQVFGSLQVSDRAHGFVSERSIFTNAQPHVGGRNLLSVDIRDFFPSVSEVTVVELLQSQLPYPPRVISQLASLCTLEGVLPQGAPTSPHLANAVFLPVDQVLQDLAAEWQVTYTRYADDLAFSGERAFSAEDAELVAGAVADAGFQLHPGKTRRLGQGARQIVAGLVVNAKALPPRETRRRWRAMFHRASRHPHEFIGRTNELAGVASFVHQYDGPLAAYYREIVDAVQAHTKEEPDAS